MCSFRCEDGRLDAEHEATVLLSALDSEIKEN